MQLTGELAPLGYAHRETEFIIAPSGTPVAGQRIYGCCGPTALASSASAALQRLVTSEQVYALCVAHGLCDAQGVSNDVHLATAAALLGLSIIQHQVYAGDSWSGWASFLGWNLGSRSYPTLIEVARGQQLVDAISGNGENASGLTYHFIMLLKRWAGGYSAYAGKTLPSGYWACDGDNYAGGNSRANGFAASDTLQFYSDTVLAAAMPCAAISFGRVAPAPPAPTGGPAVSGVPTGWHDDGTTLTAPAAPDGKQYTCVLGERAFVLANDWDPTDVPVSEEIGVDQVELGAPSQGGGSIQFFLKSGQNSYTQARGVYRVWDGQEMLALRTRINTLTAEIATLKATPPPAPVTVPAPLTPQQTNDLAVMSAIRAALA